MNSTAPRNSTFFGEPRALAYLAFTEAWERFSYYGMTALLTLYMTKQLFLPGHVEHITYFAQFRMLLEQLLGHLTPLALASQIFGLYTGFVWFTPVLGGLVADRLTGRRNAVLLGAALMCLGHFAMAYDASFLAALLLLVVGCGLLKGNISAQVGQLYRNADDTGRTRGFTIFSIGINVGSVAGPIFCGFMAQRYGWHAGFGAAGVLMLAGLLTYLAGYPSLKDVTEKSPSPAKARLAKSFDARPLLALGVVMFLTIFLSVAFYQSLNIGLVWIDRYVDPMVFGYAVPTVWFASLGSFASIVFVPVLLAFWRWQEARGFGSSDVGKIATGAWLCAGANLILALASTIKSPVSLWWPIASNMIHGLVFLYYWPTLLALVYRVAPAGLRSTLLGIAFLSLFIANAVIGELGGLYETMTPQSFWLMHALIAAAGAIPATLMARKLMRIMEPAGSSTTFQLAV